MGYYHVTIISLDSLHRCHHLIHKYSHQRNKKQNPYIFCLNHFFGLGTPTLCLELTCHIYGRKYGKHSHNNQMNIHTEIKLIKIFISVGNEEVSSVFVLMSKSVLGLSNLY